MPTGPCPTNGTVAYEIPTPDGSGSILIDCQYGWDGTSVRPSCDGPVQSIRARNTSAVTAWAPLPNKKKAPLYIQLAPGSDVTTSAAGQLANLGLSNYSDVAGVGIVFTQPA